MYLLVYYTGMYPVDVSGTSFDLNLLIIVNYLNSCCSPFIYLATYEEFRKGALGLIGVKVGLSEAQKTNSINVTAAFNAASGRAAVSVVQQHQ